ncbi:MULTISPECIES: STAS domain-containing protein [unclassified Streptomyces]|uniref:STAS domain-containing protein n=1 Tax=unclassified Streptomyces TaxID=2593676 RepID=UPI0033F47FFC
MNPIRPALLVVPSPLALADVPALCARLRSLYAAGAREVVCDVGGLVRADLAAVEAVARLRLTARRAGGGLSLRGVGPGLAALLHLTGLTE